MKDKDKYGYTNKYGYGPQIRTVVFLFWYPIIQELWLWRTGVEFGRSKPKEVKNRFAIIDLCTLPLSNSIFLKSRMSLTNFISSLALRAVERSVSKSWSFSRPRFTIWLMGSAISVRGVRISWLTLVKKLSC